MHSINDLENNAAVTSKSTGEISVGKTKEAYRAIAGEADQGKIGDVLTKLLDTLTHSTESGTLRKEISIEDGSRSIILRATDTNNFLSNNNVRRSIDRFMAIGLPPPPTEDIPVGQSQAAVLEEPLPTAPPIQESQSQSSGSIPPPPSYES
jgi:hypothetical protein